MQDFNDSKNSYQTSIEHSIGFAGQGLDFYTQVKADFLKEIAQKYFPSQRVELLDVGCGHGLIHRKLDGFSISATDIAGEVLKLAQQENPSVTYLPYDGTALPFESGRFDMSLAICVMHHVPPAAWVAFLQEMKRVLKPGGMAIIIEHNPLNPMTCHVVKNSPLDEGVTLLHARTLKKRMREAGFVQSKHEYLVFTPFAQKLMRRFDRWLKWCPLGAQHAALGLTGR
ncbi:MAG: class I SAM-dependent methyltransferase [Pseudomonadota bacterium]